MIDYNIIDTSLKFYDGEGYKRIESPWLVTEAVDNITKPVDIQSYQVKHNGKNLVASGEQSFLYLYLKGFLPKGMFQTVTPCFRSESFDFLHSKYFIKNELIRTDETDRNALMGTIDSALKFFRQYISSACVKKINNTSYDIVVLDGQQTEYELGSYGIRECSFLSWVYGTGVAEPRLSNIINVLNR